MDNHYWLRADSRRNRAALRSTLKLPPVLAEVDAHRRLRGPYTVAGTVLRAIGPDLLRRVPELGPRHHIEILTSAPEFVGKVPPIKATLELTGTSGVRTRYAARVHTLRIAHGLAECLRDYLAACGDGPRTLIVDNVHEADPTDREFLAVLLARLRPEQLTVVVGTGTEPLTEPPGPLAVSLPEALQAHTTELSDESASDSDPRQVDGLTPEQLAKVYVDGDCVDDDPLLRAAYEQLDPDRRATLHDRRAAELIARDESSLLLGAVPFHLEHGHDPAGAGVAAIREAQLRCKSLGLYHSAVDLGLRGRRLVDRESRPELWWELTGDMTTSLGSAGRADEAEAYYDESRALTADPELHMHLAYGTALLYARHYQGDKRDPKQARGWLNLAVALSSQLPNPKERAFYTVFNRNGLALVDVREGRFQEAIQRLQEGMDRLDRELEPDEYLLHRAGLRYNRAQVFMMTGRLEEALADFSHVIDQDPNFHDHYFNRGNILGRLGRYQEAIADYTEALQLSPPFAEAYYNRGDAHLELGDVDQALHDFSRVIELEPTHADARLNRAAILCDRGDESAAWSDIEAGLAASPDNPHLWCLRARLLADRGENESARDAVSTALNLDDSLAEAHAIQGALAFEAMDLDSAIDELNRAVALQSTPEMRFNRAVVYQAAGRFHDALSDYEAVLAVGDDPDARQGRDDCLAMAGAAADSQGMS